MSRQANVTANVVGKKKEDGEIKYCFTAHDDVTSKEIVWCLDSGATEHLSDEDYLTNVRKLQTPIKIKIAKSRMILNADKVGDIYVKSVTENGTVNVIIKEVLFVLRSELNLLSVRRLEFNGFTVIFKDEKGTILKGNKVIAVADRKHKLYKVNFSYTSNLAVMCETAHSLGKWHTRLGHISKIGRKLKDIVDGIEGNDIEEPLSVCSTCVEGKQTRLPYHERKRATRPMQLVHSDLFGPVTPTI
ncbi:Copia protein [Ooceraea biroi]|uniref:Copia protein n=1 Tax=Ooceraea biroi TaxID=2015173 RepID=A0A026X4H9_OOCBI|nr:Copia protein [Ooceraea biroi]